MKKNTVLKLACTGLLVFSFFQMLLLPASSAYAQQKKADVVYFIDGSSFTGIIVDINRNTIRLKDADGQMFEFPTKHIYKFSSDRPFREIYRKSIEANR